MSCIASIQLRARRVHISNRPEFLEVHRQSHRCDSVRSRQRQLRRSTTSVRTDPNLRLSGRAILGEGFVELLTRAKFRPRRSGATARGRVDSRPRGP